MRPRPALSDALTARFRRFVHLCTICAALSAPLAVAACAAVQPQAASPAAPLPAVDGSRLAGTWFLVAKAARTGESDDADSYIELQTRKAGGFDEIEHDFDHRLSQSVVLLRGRYDAVTDSHYTRWIHSSRTDPGRSELQLLYVDPDYHCLVFGDPRSRLAWIYSRTPDIGPAAYNDVEMHLEQQRYDAGRLHLVAHALLAKSQDATGS